MEDTQPLKCSCCSKCFSSLDEFKHVISNYKFLMDQEISEVEKEKNGKNDKECDKEILQIIKNYGYLIKAISIGFADPNFSVKVKAKVNCQK